MIYSLVEIKVRVALGIAEDGDRFNTPTGSIGKYLREQSASGKAKASLTCIVEGCTTSHIREISDWHQCGKCPDHAKIRLRDLRRDRRKKVDVVATRKSLEDKMSSLKDYAKTHNIGLSNVTDTE